jgi:hypothetical protein
MSLIAIFNMPLFLYSLVLERTVLMAPILFTGHGGGPVASRGPYLTDPNAWQHRSKLNGLRWFRESMPECDPGPSSKKRRGLHIALR